MQTNNNSAKCMANEEKGRFIAEKVLSDLFKNYDYSVTSTELTCPVDFKGTITTTNRNIDFTLEVKQRNKNEEILMKYPNVELRVDKYKRMLEATPQNSPLLYMVLLNQKTALVFSLKKMDWNKVNTFDWRIKKVQVDENSPYVVYPTYSIPTSLAFAQIDCSKYFQMWN